MAPMLLEALARGALRGDAPAWDAEARAGLAWIVGQVIEVKALLEIIARGQKLTGRLRG